LRVAISGSSGFVGGSLLPYVTAVGHTPVAIPRTAFDGDLENLLIGCDAFIHLAGLAHAPDAPHTAIDAANFLLPISAATAARRAGVRRFVFVSTINVVAGNTGVLTPASPIRPRNVYGTAKAKAEASLLSLSGIEIVVIRPPVVYGPHVKGNLRRLTRLCLTGLPLPFGAVDNQRSMVGITNLCSALLFLATAPTPRVDGRVFHVADARNLSLREIVETIRAAIAMPPRLLPIPVAPMKLALKLAGQHALANQLFDDLLVDAAGLLNIGWAPALGTEADLADMARSVAADHQQ
jgi:UDP-glucose 4-epimerase